MQISGLNLKKTPENKQAFGCIILPSKNFIILTTNSLLRL
jgi:hypothetical protein